MKRSLVVAGLPLVSLAPAASVSTAVHSNGATRALTRLCFATHGVKATNTHAASTLGSLGDLDLYFPTNATRATLSFDRSSTESQATLVSWTAYRRAHPPAHPWVPPYRIGNVMVDWATAPSASQRNVVLTCVNRGATVPMAPAAPAAGSSPHQTFTGSGSKDIAPFTLSHMIISDNNLDGPEPGPASQASSGSTYFPAGSYQLSISAERPWSISIS